MEPLEEGCYYHIYNRGAGKAPIFLSDDDYNLFMSKYFYYLLIPAETYAWCLLKNHFHLLIRVRTIEEQEQIFDKIKEKYPSGKFYGDRFENPKPFLTFRQLGHLFNSYTKIFNKKQNRTGTLIEGSYKRKKIIDEDHFLHVACYIHRNPLHHRIVKSYINYPYSSYRYIIEEKKTFAESIKLLSLYGGKENFKAAHREFKYMLGEEYYLE